ncbi:alpha/beta fold hydrolase [Arcticibacterium luteifluviistationis]|uniref:Alpha/beta hydrolase n=1 Tax=Arcticibacterium luteifluviistationis TaxID=1784714 RepID=A0A2Z4GCY0_9BACT|nr:alpha/beta hydrolase [Arcticibacterium luteifluviistationis]AWV98938.1 alpha/beta hydrolase [Arcticibacterium luteifluviistationis]
MAYQIKTEGKYNYVDEGEGPTLLVLHGLFGALSNFNDVVKGFKKNYRVIIPLMPIYDMPMRQASLEGLLAYIEGFVIQLKLKDMILLGNSLGGHVGLLYTLAHPESVASLVLTGSSGLFENTMGGSFPKRGNYEYIKERVEYTFYDPKTATKELVDECFEITSSIPKCMNIVQIAKSAQRNNMASEIPSIKVPTCLIWGLNDTITPPHVGHEFNRLMPNSELHFIDKCCHAPMMERPVEFNEILEKFLAKINKLVFA